MRSMLQTSEISAPHEDFTSDRPGHFGCGRQAGRAGIHPILPIALAAAMAVAGCDLDEAAEHSNSTETSARPPSTSDEHSDQHAETGPHGGHLIELGHNHKYHAELVEDDATETVRVYILDTDMKELAIDQESIVLNLTAGGQTTAYELSGAGDGQPAGHSCFESTEKNLSHSLEKDADVSTTLRVTIEGVPYIGRFAHDDHEHDEAKDRH